MTNIDLPETDAKARMELRGLMVYLWSGRRVIAYTIVAFTVLGLLWYRLAPRVYEASAVLSAAPGSSTGGVTGNPLSGAARLIGLGGPGGPAGVEYTKFQSLLSSSILAERLAKEGILQQMYPKRWDASTHSWKSPSGFFSPISSAVRAALGMPARHEPSARDIEALLKGSLVQNLSLQTSLLDLSFTSTDPEFAKMFLTRVHRDADNILRENARTRSARRIHYLQQTLINVTAVEQRSALIQLLNQETQTSMMIESDPNYSADMVDPPSVTPDPISPKFVIVMLGSVLGGLIAGVILYVLQRNFNLRAMWPRWNFLRRPAALRQRSP